MDLSVPASLAHLLRPLRPPPGVPPLLFGLSPLSLPSTVTPLDKSVAPFSVSARFRSAAAGFCLLPSGVSRPNPSPVPPSPRFVGVKLLSSSSSSPSVLETSTVNLTSLALCSLPLLPPLNVGRFPRSIGSARSPATLRSSFARAFVEGGGVRKRMEPTEDLKPCREKDMDLGEV